MSNEEKDESMGEVIRIDEGRMRDHLGEMVRGTVEEALAERKPKKAPVAK